MMNVTTTTLPLSVSEETSLVQQSATPASQEVFQFSLVIWALTVSVGVVGNALLCVTIGSSPSLRTAMNVYVFGIGLVDLLTCALFLPLRMATESMARGGQDVPEGLYSTELLARTTTELARLVFIQALSAERYQAIARPFSVSKVTARRRAIGVSAIIWVLVLVLGGMAVRYFCDTALFLHCATTRAWGDLELYIELPLTLIAIMSISMSYSLILLVLHQQRKKMAKHNNKQPKPKANQVAPVGQESISTQQRRCFPKAQLSRLQKPVDKLSQSKTNLIEDKTKHEPPSSARKDQLYGMSNTGVSKSSIDPVEGIQQDHTQNAMSSTKRKNSLTQNTPQDTGDLENAQNKNNVWETSDILQSKMDRFSVVTSHSSLYDSHVEDPASLPVSKSSSCYKETDPNKSQNTTIANGKNIGDLNLTIVGSETATGYKQELFYPTGSKCLSVPISPSCANYSIDRSDFTTKSSIANMDVTSKESTKNTVARKMSIVCSNDFESQESPSSCQDGYCNNSPFAPAGSFLTSSASSQYTDSHSEKTCTSNVTEEETRPGDISNCASLDRINELKDTVVVSSQQLKYSAEKDNFMPTTTDMAASEDDTSAAFNVNSSSVDQDLANTLEKPKTTSAEPTVSNNRTHSFTSSGKCEDHDEHADIMRASISINQEGSNLNEQPIDAGREPVVNASTSAVTTENVDNAPDTSAKSYPVRSALTIVESCPPHNSQVIHEPSVIEKIPEKPVESAGPDIETIEPTSIISTSAVNEKRVEIVEMDGTVHLEKETAVTKRSNSVAPHIEGAVCLMNPKNKEIGRRKVELKAALKVGLLFLSFLLLWTPLPVLATVIRVTSEVAQGSTQANVLGVFSALASSTAAVDPILYGLLNRQIRNSMKQMLKKARRKLNQILRPNKV